MRKIASIVFLAAFSSANFAQQDATPVSRKPLTPEALISLHRLSDLEFSPDGSRIAFVVSEPPKSDRPPAHIWLFHKFQVRTEAQHFASILGCSIRIDYRQEAVPKLTTNPGQSDA